MTVWLDEVVVVAAKVQSMCGALENTHLLGGLHLVVQSKMVEALDMVEHLQSWRTVCNETRKQCCSNNKKSVPTQIKIYIYLI